ncbi:Aminoacyl tRNA synthase complex-interacting multifunctional protein 1 [Blattella germanica]|nr:Aminoacyl tRNA synthase complex-interacting multifunctional protein 1 [Blattella germanica]
MWCAAKKVIFRRLSKNLLNVYCGRNMTSEQLARLETRAITAEEMIQTLKCEVEEIKRIAIQRGSDDRVKELTAENEQLKIEIEAWKEKLIQLEISNGIKQVPLPSKNEVPAQQTEIKLDQTPVKVAPPASQVTAAEAGSGPDTTKAEKKKKDKPDKPAEGKKGKSGGGGGGSTAEEPPVDVGRLDFRVSGLVKFVPVEELQNRLVVLLCNLKPVKMRGVTSEAMVMCASTPEKVEVLLPPEGSAPGDEVHVEGYPRVPDSVLNPKKKVFETVAPDLKTNSEKVATYKGIALTVPGKGAVTAPSLVGVNIK